jgi:hypothetical protein
VDDIKLDNMPNPGELRQWKIDLIEKVMYSHVQNQTRAFKWIKEVDTAVTVEELGKETFPELDAKLGKAMKESIKKNSVFSAKMTQLIEQGHVTGKRLTSRQMVWYMYQFLKPKSRGENLYELKDLFEVALGAHSVRCSISELEHFLLRWDTVLTTMNKPPDEDTLHTLFYKQIHEIALLEFDMKAYDRLDEHDKTYSKLYNTCERLISLHRSEENQKKIHGRLRQNVPHASAPAPPAKSRSPGRGRSHSRTGSHRSGSRNSGSGKRFGSQGGKPRSKSRSPNRKTSRDKPCIDFAKGKCTRGAGCKYSHSKDGSRNDGRANSPKRGYSPKRGSSPGKSRLRTPTPERFKRPCHSFAKGSCKYGDKCVYSHSMVKPAAPGIPEKGSSGNRSSNSPAPESSFH